MMTMAAATLSAIAQQPVDYVNPIIGERTGLWAWKHPHESEIDYTDLAEENPEPKRGDSERNTHALSQSKKVGSGYFHE